ncbi:uncharacterized protein [Emydura macquarii macquarii]|uniref:uncharacterized protein isoform X3 n=1 Tax=Emydura macquarii macquarii TaxID=1129001 RepID=UPI00352B0171
MLAMQVLHQWPVLVSAPEMDDKVDKSPCAELVPAALDLPWNEMDSPPAGDPVPELLDQELPDQEEPAETDDDDEEEPEPSEARTCPSERPRVATKAAEESLPKESGAKGKGAAIGAAIGVGAVGLSVSVQAGLSTALGSVGAAIGSFFSSK